MDFIEWDDFAKIDFRVGTIIKAEDFPEARRPAYKLTVDFGEEIGMRKSSAQITDLYTKEELVGNPPKQIGPFMSQCLVTGFYREDGSVSLAVPDKECQNGARLG